MKQIVKACLFLFMFMGVSGVSLADEKANETKQGTIRGRIVDASKQILPGASVYIDNSSLKISLA